MNGPIRQPRPGGRRGGRAARALAVALATVGAFAPWAVRAGAAPADPRILPTQGGSGNHQVLTVVGPPTAGPDPLPGTAFTVLAEEVEIPATVTPLPRRPLEVVLVADVTGGENARRAIGDGLTWLVRRLPQGTSVGLVTASASPELVLAPTTDGEAVTAALDALEHGAPASPDAAIELALGALPRTPKAHQVLVVPTFGAYDHTAPRPAGVEQRLRKETVDTYAVELGAVSSYRLPLGDGMVVPAGLEDLPAAFGTVLDDLGAPRYAVEFDVSTAVPVQVVVESDGQTGRAVTIVEPERPAGQPAAPAGDRPESRAGIGLVVLAVGALLALVLTVPSLFLRRRAGRRTDRPLDLAEGTEPAAGTPIAPPTGTVVGVAAVRALLESGRRPVRTLWLADDLDVDVAANLQSLAARRRIPVRRRPRPELARHTGSDGDEGVLADAAPPTPRTLEALCHEDEEHVPLLLVLVDDLSPDELGATLSAAEGRFTGVVLHRRLGELVPAASLRAGAAAEALPFAFVGDPLAALVQIREAGLRTAAAAPGLPPVDGPVPEPGIPTAFLVTAAAVDRATLARCDAVIRLPPDTGLPEAVEHVGATLAEAVGEPA